MTSTQDTRAGARQCGSGAVMQGCARGLYGRQPRRCGGAWIRTRRTVNSGMSSSVALGWVVHRLAEPVEAEVVLRPGCQGRLRIDPVARLSRKGRRFEPVAETSD